MDMQRGPFRQDTHANTRCLYPSFNTTAVWGGCGESNAHFLCRFLTFLFYMRNKLKTDTHNRKKWVSRWPKITMRVKRKRGCEHISLKKIWKWDQSGERCGTKGKTALLSFSWVPFYLTKKQLPQTNVRWDGYLWLIPTGGFKIRRKAACYVERHVFHVLETYQEKKKNFFWVYKAKLRKAPIRSFHEITPRNLIFFPH